MVTKILHKNLTDTVERLCKEFNYNLFIYTFGSGLQKPDAEISTDYDLLVLGPADEARRFEEDLGTLISKTFSKAVPFRHSMLDKKPGQPYLHFMHFKDEEDWLENDGPVIINAILKNHKIINGKKLNIKSIQITSREQIMELLERYAKKIQQSEDNELKADFLDYLSKIVPKLTREYPQFERELSNFYKEAKEKI